MRRAALALALLSLAGCGADDPGNERVAATPQHTARPDLPPLPSESKARVVAPAAGVTASDEDYDAIAVGKAEPEDLPEPKAPASRTREGGGAPAAVDGSLTRATALPNGIALPPLEAPDEVLKVIEAGNVIARSPYKWGGGHGRFLDDGYDCSGSVSFALYAAGLIEGSRTSGGLKSWGRPGRGKWITVWTNDGHVFMEVAGLRFDTVARKLTGSRWENAPVSGSGYVARHPPGL